MVKTIKFFSRTPTAVRFKQHSAVQTTSEYAGTNEPTGTVVQNSSSSIPGVAELVAKVDALSAIVEKLAVNQGLSATMPNPEVDGAAVAQSSKENSKPAVVQNASELQSEVTVQEEPTPTVTETADAQIESGDEVPEGIPEGNLGAEVPANDGKPYTEVPEDDIIKQFSKSANMSPEAASKLGLSGKETFGCLFN